MPTRLHPVFSITLQQRRRLAATAALLAFVMIPGPGALADGTDRLTERMADSGCSDAAIRVIGERARAELEHNVQVGEIAIEPPRSVSDLGCFDRMFKDVEIDTFAPSLDSSIWTSAFDSWIDTLARGVCAFAHDQWEKLTPPIFVATGQVQRLDAVLQPSALLPASPETRPQPPQADPDADAGDETDEGDGRLPSTRQPATDDARSRWRDLIGR
ncbi:MAG: hypothetical protein OXE86_09340 [Alphaproteobacteria bacterium]|nr:hypothetical protein [Alphaproteobacteria bacterium]